MSGKIFDPLLLLIARLTDPELARSVQFLKAENKVLRSKLPKQVRTTPAERRRLLKLAEPLGSAVRDLLTIVSYRTFLRWKADEGKTGKRKKSDRKPGRKRTPEEIREIVVRLAKENGWGYTRILGELKKLRIKVCRNTVKNILKEEGFDLGPKRGEGTWDEFMKIHRSSLWACDMISQKVWTLTGRVEYFILFFVEVATRRVRILGAGAREATVSRLPLRRLKIPGMMGATGPWRGSRPSRICGATVARGGIAPEDLRMESAAVSVNGSVVRLTDERWAHITEEHCELAGMRTDVLETVSSPDSVLAGGAGELLAVRQVSPGRFMVAVYREAGEDGFVITAFLTSRFRSLERRRKLWP